MARASYTTIFCLMVASVTAAMIPNNEKTDHEKEQLLFGDIYGHSSSSVGRHSSNRIESDLDSLRQALKGLSEEEMKAFTPPPVVDPQCYVEVEVVQRFPGRCIMLGGKIPGCQSQEWLSVYSEACMVNRKFSV
ncbi:Uncharacterised protein g119 [Pycnogonum litorale]